MRKYNVTLTIKEQGAKNAIRIKAKQLTEEAIDNLIQSHLLEMADSSRKEMIAAFAEYKKKESKPLPEEK